MALFFLDTVASFGALAKKAVAPVVASTALSPLVYLPFHLAGHHLTARLLPNKRFTYPAHLAFALTQYCVEHYSAELPSVAALGPALVAVALAMTPYIYYRAFTHTEGPKALIWSALAMFFVMLGVFKGMELGFPKDTPEEQAIANLDRTHSLWHLVLHVAILVNQLMVNACVPWTPKAQLTMTPPSPAHSTRAAARQYKTAVDEPCSPQSAKKRGFANAAKTIKAA